MIDPILLGALFALSATLLLLVVLAAAAVVWLWVRLAKFRRIELDRERVEGRIQFFGSVQE